MSANNMKPPYYILVNDTDRTELKFYHETHYGKVQYEGTYGDFSYETALFSHGEVYHVGPRRMHYIETALKFRDKISKIKNLPKSSLKIVKVDGTLKQTFTKIKKGQLKEIEFEGGIYA